MQKSVHVSPEVIRALSTSEKTADEILREVLHVQAAAGMVVGGVTFPEGTLFLAWHKDRPHWGRVVKGELDINGTTYQTLTKATRAITHRGGTGWDLWLCKMPNSQDFVKIKMLRSADAEH